MIFLELKEFTKGRIKATETVELSEQNSPPLPSLSVFCETKMGEASVILLRKTLFLLQYLASLGIVNCKENLVK